MSRPRSGRAVVRRAMVLVGFATTLANTAGAVVVFVMLVFVLPVPDVAEERSVIIGNLVLGSAYALLAAAFGVVTGLVQMRRRLRWLVEDAEPTREDRRRTTGIPFAASVRQLSLWLVAVVLFAAVNAGTSVVLAVEVALTILIGGVTTTATTYLLVERATRRAVSRAFATRGLRRLPGAGVAWRTVLTWGLGTGLPLVGLILLSGVSLGVEIPADELSMAVFVLGLTAWATGLVSITVLARSIADPMRDLRAVLQRIEEGDLDVVVDITDTTEVGVLQSGVNRMVEGLRERDLVRDLFGRHVGEHVAGRAIREGVELGGEVRTAAALFVDVVGSTGIAEDHDPQHVLGLLNSFFGVVVEVIDQHDGVVNKFMGDAVLAIWGAPIAVEEPATAALRAARELARRLAGEVSGLRAGIGVAAGTVVAGNLGASTRLEYTVIGDPVNIASRLSDRAKGTPSGVLASRATVDAAEPDEQRCWEDAGEEVVRGRSTPTRLATPIG